MINKMKQFSDQEKAKEINRILLESLKYQETIEELSKDPEKNAEAIRNNRGVLSSAAVRILKLLPSEVNYFYFTAFPDIGAAKIPDNVYAFEKLQDALENSFEGYSLEDFQRIKVFSFDDICRNWNRISRINNEYSSGDSGLEAIDDEPQGESELNLLPSNQNHFVYQWQNIKDQVLILITTDV